MKLVIVVDLDRFPRPTTEELDEWDFDLLTYFTDYLFEDPLAILDGCTTQLMEDDDGEPCNEA